MGYSQGKMLRAEEIDNTTNQSEKLILSKQNFQVIFKSTKKNVECLIIEFVNLEVKIIDCELSLNKINFEEEYENDFLFESVIKVFENLGLNLPLIIYLSKENSRINLFLKLKQNLY